MSNATKNESKAVGAIAKGLVALHGNEQTPEAKTDIVDARHFKALAAMKSLHFGIEIETTGRGRQSCAEAIARRLQETLGLAGEVRDVAARFGYGSIGVVLPDGRVWRCASDTSINGYENAEIVSPVLGWADIPMLQEVVRALRKNGSRVDESCGIHIHVDATERSPLNDPNAVARLARIVYTQEEFIFAATNRLAGRRGGGCPVRRIDPSFLARLPKRSVTERSLNVAWYGQFNGSVSRGTEARGGGDHYNRTRYAGLNIHAYFQRGTIEFRYFDATLHAGKVKSFVHLVLALAAKAATSRSAVARKRPFNRETAAYDWRIVLVNLYLRGDEFKTTRKHLGSKFDGSSSAANSGRNRGGVERDAIRRVEDEADLFDNGVAHGRGLRLREQHSTRERGGPIGPRVAGILRRQS